MREKARSRKKPFFLREKKSFFEEENCFLTLEP